MKKGVGSSNSGRQQVVGQMWVVNSGMEANKRQNKGIRKDKDKENHK